MTEFQDLYLGTFQPLDPELMDLATAYYRQAEAFDRTVCTGPITRDGIMPATARELAQINRYAAELLKELRRKSEERGFSQDDLRHAMKVAVKNGFEMPQDAA